MKLYEREISREIRFEGKIFKTAVCRAELPNGTIVSREVSVHSGGVGILPVDNDGYGYFVRQFRYGAQKVLLEVPAGKLEYGEEPLPAALRELSEETGFKCKNAVSMGTAYSSPAILTEVIHLYLATDLDVGDAHPDNDEFLELERIKLTDAVQMVLNNEIEDGKTQILVLKAAKHLGLI